VSRPRRGWGHDAPPDPHIWNTLGYRSTEPGIIEWDATPAFCFHDGAGGFIVHGGMVTTLLDTAMGGACWAVLEDGESFLTADLRSEFLRSARPGTLRAEGCVVQRNRRVAFCAADLFQDDTLIATARCTQIIRSS
jgi:uncharacterized protein (TIGR00369 family)